MEQELGFLEGRIVLKKGELNDLFCTFCDVIEEVDGKTVDEIDSLFHSRNVNLSRIAKHSIDNEDFRSLECHGIRKENLPSYWFRFISFLAKYQRNSLNFKESHKPFKLRSFGVFPLEAYKFKGHNKLDDVNSKVRYSSIFEK
ncbi:hypothetical protein GCM10027299_34540 [Larkinella ripae]